MQIPSAGSASLRSLEVSDLHGPSLVQFGPTVSLFLACGIYLVHVCYIYLYMSSHNFPGSRSRADVPRAVPLGVAPSVKVDLDTFLKDLPVDVTDSNPELFVALRNSYGDAASRADVAEILCTDAKVSAWATEVGLEWSIETIRVAIRQWKVLKATQCDRWASDAASGGAASLDAQAVRVDHITHALMGGTKRQRDHKRMIQVDAAPSAHSSPVVSQATRALAGFRQGLSIPLSLSSRDDVEKALMAIFYECGERGLKWEHATTPEHAQVRDNNVRHALVNFSTKSLKTHLAAWRRWTRWCNSRTTDPPDPVAPARLHVSTFLQSIRGNGPTAAMGVISGLQWFEEHIGTPFHTDAPQLASFWSRAADVQPSKKRRSGQAEVPPPSVFHRLLIFLSLQRGVPAAVNTPSIFVALVLTVLIGCVRFAHAQVSRVNRVTARFILFRCEAGKRKVDGVQEPFNWAVPRVLAPGIDLWHFLGPLYDLMPDCSFVFPDLMVGKWSGLGKDTRWVQQAMTYERFSRLWRGLLTSLNFCEVWISSYTTYSLRRWLPTIAGALKFSREQKQAIGNWVEVPEAAEKDSRAIYPMSMKYDDDKDIMAGHTKGLAVVVIHALLDLDEATYKVKVEGVHTKQELEHLRKSVQASENGDFPTRMVNTWTSDAWQVGTEDKPAEVASAAILKVHTTPSKPTDVAASSQDEKSPFGEEDPHLPLKDSTLPPAPSDDKDALEIMDEEEVPENCDHEFLIQDSQSRTARVHFVLVYDLGWPVPACRAKKGGFSRWPKYTGWHPSKLPSGESLVRCTECFRQLSPEEEEIWSDFL